MKKSLNETAIINELKSGSVFFQKPVEPAAAVSHSPLKQAAQDPVVPVESPIKAQPPLTTPPLATSSTSPSEPETKETPVRTPARTSVRPHGSTPGRRTITRYAFEFFQDQIETLRGFSLDEKQRGEKGSMSEMVREAVDMYIAKRHRIEGE